jgi:hypothetical protein
VPSERDGRELEGESQYKDRNGTAKLPFDSVVVVELGVC